MLARVRAALIVPTLLLPGCSGPALAQSASSGQPSVLQAPLPSFAPLVKRVVPAVVNIAVTEATGPVIAQLPPGLRGTPLERQFRERLRERSEQVIGAGSGFVIDPAGTIVTNNHVVGHADRIVVSLANGTQLPAQLVGVDDLTDIAVIQVKSAEPLPAVSWGDSRKVEVGDWIMAAGNPFGLGSSVTAGIVSARGRDIGAGPFDDFLQIDAPINPGNSGGPTFNLEGQVIAVNTAIVSPTGGSVGIGFAVPSEIASRIVAELRAKGHIDRGWLGVSVEDVGEGQPGVAIAGVEHGGPAAKAGLRPGDVVLAINGVHLDSTRALTRAVAATPPGDSVHVELRRGHQAMDLAVTVGRRPAEQSE